MRRRRIRLARAVRNLLTAALAGALSLAPVAAAHPAGLSLASGATFPNRTLVLSAPANVPVSVPSIYVWENGKPVDDLSVTPISHADKGDFGVVLVIDQSKSMNGAPLTNAMAAARRVAAQRQGNQELGVVMFDSTPTELLPLTSSSSAIDHALTQTPRTASGSHVLPAVGLAMHELEAANIADGAVIVLSDGAANGSTGGLTVPSIAASAQAHHIRIFTVGLDDSAYAPTLLKELASQGGGQFTAATAAGLPDVFTGIASALTRSYLLRYRSILPANEHVAVKLHIDGVKSPLQLGYYARTSASTSGSAPTSSAPSKPVSPTPAVHQAAVSPLAQLPKLPVSGTIHLPSTTSRIVSAPSSGATQPNPTAQPHPIQVARSSTGFWTTSLGMFTIAMLCALLVGLGVAILLRRQSSRLDVHRRLDSYSTGHLGEQTSQTDDEDNDAPSLLTRRAWWNAFTEQVQAGRVQHSPMSLVKRTGLAAVVVAILLAALTGTPALGLFPLIVAPFVLRAWVARAARRQRTAFADQLPIHLQDLAGSIRSGRSFVGALGAVAETTTEPMAGELDRALTDEKLGLPLERALEAIGERMHSKDMSQVALIAALNRSSGANVAESLDRVAESARERADLVREMKALTGQARMSSWVLSGLPPLMLLGLTVIAPTYAHPLFHTTLGIVLLGVAALMVFGGWRVMKRIVTVEV
jgi:tight adherence protein B